MKRILKLNYLQNDMTKLQNWLNDNDDRFEIIHGNNGVGFAGEVGFAGGDVIVGTLLVSLELYSDEAEVATRLKWNIEHWTSTCVNLQN